MLYIYTVIDILIYLYMSLLIISILLLIIFFQYDIQLLFFIFPTTTYCWKFTCTYIICIAFMYLFIICSSCSSFIPIRNLKLYTNIIATPIDTHDKVEIIHYAHIYITVLNPPEFGRCSPVLQIGL